MLCVADPHLGSIDDVIVFMFFSTCLQSKGIAPRLCFREAETSNLCDMTCLEVQENITAHENAEHLLGSQEIYSITLCSDVIFMS